MRKTQRIFMVTITSIAVIVISLFALVRYLEKTAVFFPNKNITQTPKLLGMDFEDVFINTPDGEKINAWFVPSHNNAATLIYAHGNAGAMGDRLLKVRFFHELGLNVLVFDYRGFGKSTGTPTEKGVYIDGASTYDYLLTRKDIDPSKIIYYGASLGGAVAIDVATKRPLAALIVDSSMTSAKEVAGKFYPFVPSFMMQIKFDSINKIQKVSAPKLFIHSPEDRTIPYAMGLRLFEKASEPKMFLKSVGGHNEIQILNDPHTAATLKEFLIGIKLL